MWWYILAIQVCKRQRQEDPEFENRLGNIANFWTAYFTYKHTVSGQLKTNQEKVLNLNETQKKLKSLSNHIQEQCFPCYTIRSLVSNLPFFTDIAPLFIFIQNEWQRSTEAHQMNLKILGWRKTLSLAVDFSVSHSGNKKNAIL